MLEVLSLIENFSSSTNLYSEHGLSLFIKQDNKNYLIDTGATDKFIENAKTMGIDLKKLNAIVISHNHCDHIGGLPALLEYNSEVKVYIKNAAINEYYLKIAFIKKYIGEEKGLFDKYKNRFIFVENELKITNKFELLSTNIIDKEYSCKDKNLLIKKNNLFVADDFKHELFAVFEEEDGLTIISSCSHNGIVNIVNSIKQKYKNKPILNIVGGFHLKGFGIKPLNCTKEYIMKIAELLDNSCQNKIYTCHCTGKKAFGIMKDRIGEKISYMKTGENIIL